MGNKSTLSKREKELIQLTLQKVLERLNNEVQLQTGHPMSVKYQDIVLMTKVY
jgi:hypothetical protein